MKDKNGVELKIGDIIKDDAGNLGRVIIITPDMNPVGEFLLHGTDKRVITPINEIEDCITLHKGQNV